MVRSVPWRAGRCLRRASLPARLRGPVFARKRSIAAHRAVWTTAKVIVCRLRPDACAPARVRDPGRPGTRAAPCMLRPRLSHRRGVSMNMHLALTPLISLVAGILILVMPKLLNFIVAVYLILIGLVGLFGGSLRLG
jgi:hypothetical protein